MEKIITIFIAMILLIPAGISHTEDFPHEEGNEVFIQEGKMFPGVGENSHGPSDRSFEFSKPQSFSGPGGCDSPEKCMEFCSDNPSECPGFSSGAVARFEGIEHFDKMDPVQMVVGKIFMSTDYRPEDFQQYCSDPEQMVDIAIATMKKEDAFKLDCSSFEEEVEQCREMSKNACEPMKDDAFMAGPYGLTCDNVDEDVVYDSCMQSNKELNSQYSSQNSCEQQWNMQQSDSFCESIDMSNCDKESYLETKEEEARQDCEAIYPEDIENRTQLVDQCIEEMDMESSWESQEQICETNSEVCDKDAFMESCLEREEEFQEEQTEFLEEMCEQESEMIVEDLEQMCEQNEEIYEECVDDSEKMCDFIEKSADKCSDVSEEDIREEMIKQAKRYCKFAHYQEEEKYREFFSTIQEAKAELPSEYKILVDEKAGSVIETDEKIEEIDGKGIGYKLKWLVGAAAEEEKKDVQELRNSAGDLQSTIEALKLAAEQVENETVKNALKQEIDRLEKRVKELQSMADRKENRSKGLLSMILGD